MECLPIRLFLGSTESSIHWLNYHRGHDDNSTSETCASAEGAVPLKPLEMREQEKMFVLQRALREKLAAAKKSWETQPWSGKYLLVNFHPRRALKYPMCLQLGLVHQLMNLECEIELAFLLRRILLPYPLWEAAKFTGCENRATKFRTLVNVSGLPIDEDVQWPPPNRTGQWLRADHAPLPWAKLVYKGDGVTSPGQIPTKTSKKPLAHGGVPSFIIDSDPRSLEEASASTAPIIHLARAVHERASSNCVEYAWCAPLAGSRPLRWAKSVEDEAENALRKLDQVSRSASRKALNGEGQPKAPFFDAVHVRAGDKVGATDPLVGVPALKAGEITARIEASFFRPRRATRSHRDRSPMSALSGGDRAMEKPLLVVASDTPQLVDKASLQQTFRVVMLSDLLAGAEGGGREPSGTAVSGPPNNQCAGLAKLAVEMAVMERSAGLVISEHSNIGRRLTLLRAQAAESARTKGTSRASVPSAGAAQFMGAARVSHDPLFVRYLYSLEVWRLRTPWVNAAEWEFAVKRGEEYAVADLDSRATRHAACALPDSFRRSRGVTLVPEKPSSLQSTVITAGSAKETKDTVA
eukprot:CAMPEP_0172647866 /NCGR_PEP_ID=MMETSP1068-20121228/240969_1 /TAXON_ID=35684 /ORGANISM="Pseudopedinella elastica, Strain CCMP716" /LENGTH=580 /DNA_ID=CAMNT_0013462155 /DNA_START=499 /DNA_END=2242 /DNA_ORIENTATION=-